LCGNDDEWYNVDPSLAGLRLPLATKPASLTLIELANSSWMSLSKFLFLPVSLELDVGNRRRAK
jgi:hypothetical protein